MPSTIRRPMASMAPFVSVLLVSCALAGCDSEPCPKVQNDDPLVVAGPATFVRSDGIEFSFTLPFYTYESHPGESVYDNGTLSIEWAVGLTQTPVWVMLDVPGLTSAVTASLADLGATVCACQGNALGGPIGARACTTVNDRGNTVEPAECVPIEGQIVAREVGQQCDENRSLCAEQLDIDIEAAGERFDASIQIRWQEELDLENTCQSLGFPVG